MINNLIYFNFTILKISGYEYICPAVVIAKLVGFYKAA